MSSSIVVLVIVVGSFMEPYRIGLFLVQRVAAKKRHSSVVGAALELDLVQIRTPVNHIRMIVGQCAWPHLLNL